LTASVGVGSSGIGSKGAAWNSAIHDDEQLDHLGEASAVLLSSLQEQGARTEAE
jgi:hypothetical protein